MRVRLEAIAVSDIRMDSNGTVSPKEERLPFFSMKLPEKVRKLVVIMGGGKFGVGMFDEVGVLQE